MAKFLRVIVKHCAIIFTNMWVSFNQEQTVVAIRANQFHCQ